MSKSRAMTVVALVLLATTLLQGCTSMTKAQQGSDGQGAPKTFADSATAADHGLKLFQELVTEDNYQELGFQSEEEVSRAELGAPLSVAMVRLDHLREYDQETDPDSLLTPLGQDHYPVKVGDQTRSSIVTERLEKGWGAVSFGNAGLAKQVASATEAAADLKEARLIQIAALGLFFVGFQDGQREWQVIPLTDRPDLDLRANHPVPARRAFAALVQAARDYNGEPL